jgi:hypothetical protein
MKKLLSLILIIILTSSCAKQLDCKAKPDPKIDIDEDSNIEVTPGARIACEF